MTSASSITTEVSASTIPDYFNYTIRPCTTTIDNTAPTTATTVSSCAADEELPISPSRSPEIVPPSLDELLDHNTPQDSQFNLQSFKAFLVNVHCEENLQFVLDAASYLSLHPPTLVRWQQLYYEYIATESPSEINLPCYFKSLLSPLVKPDLPLLMKCKRHIHDEILVNLYHEFTKAMKCRELHKCGGGLPCCVRQISPTQNKEAICDQKKKKKHHVVNKGYDYYTVPSSDSSNSTTEDLLDGSAEGSCREATSCSTTNTTTTESTSLKANPSNSRGIALGSTIIETIKSVDYKIKIRKFKFRRSSTDV